MNKKYLLIYVAIFLIFSPYFVYAQRSIGEVKKDSEVGEATLDYPLEQWVNKRFIFLDLPKYDRRQGYSELSLRKSRFDFAPHNSELEEITGLKYDKFCGKIIKAVDCEKDPETSYRKTVTFIEEDSKIKIYGHTLNDCINGIALFDDLGKAKERWLGKSLYSKYKNIQTYDQNLDKYGAVKVKMEDPLKVIDIWWGVASSSPFFSSHPLWVLVETPRGVKGFLSTAFSWTNISPAFWSKERPWEEVFFESNPRKKYGWSDEIWKLINDSKVRIGMNKDQVRLSWGLPDRINKDIFKGSIREQWVYGSQYLYFEGEKVTAMQTSK